MYRGAGSPVKIFFLNFTNFFSFGCFPYCSWAKWEHIFFLMFCSGRAKAFRIVILRFLGLFDEDSAKKLSISYLLSRAVHLLKALQAQPVTVSLDSASWANLRKCDMKRKEHVCRTIFKKISRNLVAHLRPAAYVLVLVGWAALDFVCCSNTRRTSTLCVPDL